MKIYTKPELAIENIFAAETVANTYGGDVVVDPFDEPSIGNEVEVKGSKNDDWWGLLGGGN